MAAWQLAEAGATVHGFEQHAIGHDQGAAGGESRRFATHAMGEQREVPLALDATRLWRELEARTGRQLLTLRGGLIIGPEDAPGLINAQKSVIGYDLPHEHLTYRDLRARYPQHQIYAEHVGLFDPNAGHVRPQVSIVAAVEAARHAGATISDHTRVTAVEPDDDGVTIVTTDGVQRFGCVIVSPGPWFAQLLPQFCDRIQARRVLQAWFIARDVSAYRDATFPVFQRTGDVRVYGFPTVDGATVKLGVVAKIPEVVSDPDEVDLRVADAQRAEFRAMVTEYLPGLYPDPVRVSVYMEGYSSSMQGLVGPVRELPNTVVVCGLSGTGFKFAPVLGHIAAQYALTGATTYDASFYLPDRPQDTWPCS
jgi:sarcosine oxidase